MHPPAPRWGHVARVAAAAAVVASTAWSAGATAAPAANALVPIEQYTTAKARSLATLYRPQMLELHQHLDHCVPWVEVPKDGIGFRSPKGASGDERYFTLWIWIEQGADPGFAAMRTEERASAMFSRYGIPLLRRMAGLEGVATDDSVDGFAVVLSWVKPDRARPAVNETLVSFVDRTTARGLAVQTVGPGAVAQRARLSLFDGTTELDRPHLQVWEDPFLGTFRPKDYTPPPGTTC